MLDALVVENFKGFGDRQVVPLAPLTLIYGGNSAGKSSLIQALLLMRQSVARTDRIAPSREADLVVRGELVDLGSFDALVHRHERKRELTIGWSALIGRGMASSRSQGFTLAPDAVASSSLTFKRPADASQISHAASTLGDVRFVPIDARVRREVDRSLDRESFSSRDGDRLVADVAGTRRLLDIASIMVVRLGADDPDWIDRAYRDGFRLGEVISERGAQAVVSGSAGLPAQLVGFMTTADFVPLSGLHDEGPTESGELNELQEAGRLIQRWLSEATRASRNAIASVEYLGPFRKAPERLHILTGELARRSGNRGEYVVDLLARRPGLLVEVNRWFERLEIPYSLDVRAVSDRAVAGAIGEVHCLLLKDGRTGVEVAPTDVGFGIGQVLPVITQACLSERSTLCIEQPEIHLHPALQARLADLFAQRVMRPRTQFVLETHSEHLILRLQRLIRQGTLPADKVGVLYVGEGEDGQGRVTSLRLDERGEFRDEWPGGFFDERFDEIFGE